jgi:hypothetical protein
MTTRSLTPADFGWPNLVPKELIESERNFWLEEEEMTWWYREQAIWEAVNGCGKTYDENGREVQ